VQTGRLSMRPTTIRLACAVVAAVVALTVAELTSERFREFMSDHSLISTFIAEVILLAGVYLVIDELIERREARRWGDVTSLGLRALSAVAHRPGEIVRRMVDELAVETRRAQPASRHDGDEASPSEPVDYHKLVSVHGEELGDWLRANEARARSFAEETRQSAFRLEEAIVRWGPTLVESPDSAELLNLLPDIVDAARSAAEAIVPASGRLHRVRGREETGMPVGGWTEDDRRRFRDSLLEILRNEGKFDQPLRR
jgi:hypothetical protein